MTTQATKPSDFDSMINALEHPKRPIEPKSFIKESNYENKASYYLALGEAYQGYENDLKHYEYEAKEFQSEIRRIKDAFKDFCIKELCYDELSDETKTKVYNLAHESGGNFQEIYDEMDSFAEIANDAFHDCRRTMMEGMS